MRALAVLIISVVVEVLGNYPVSTKEWDFMIETGSDAADVKGGIPLQKGGLLPKLNNPVGWRNPVVTALGWGFEGEEIA